MSFTSIATLILFTCDIVLTLHATEAVWWRKAWKSLLVTSRSSGGDPNVPSARTCTRPSLC